MGGGALSVPKVETGIPDPEVEIMQLVRRHCPEAHVRHRAVDTDRGAGRYVGEGFDDPRLDTLFLTLPVSWRGTVARFTR